jgi:hypothetical protein
MRRSIGHSKSGIYFICACFGFYQLGLAGAYQVYGCTTAAVFLQCPVLQKSAEVGGGAYFARNPLAACKVVFFLVDN